MRLLALLLCSAALASSTAKRRCKLSPFDATWPIDAEWAALNESIKGSLIKTRPAASSCYKTNPFNAPLNCNIVEANWTQSTFHANLPESISSPLYANNSCLPPGAPGYNKMAGCHLGGYPSYVVNATSDEQIALAVKWALERNIRIVVKGTGHDLSGRFVFLVAPNHMALANTILIDLVVHTLCPSGLVTCNRSSSIRTGQYLGPIRQTACSSLQAGSLTVMQSVMPSSTIMSL